MKTTLREIFKHHPCRNGVCKLAAGLGYVPVDYNMSATGLYKQLTDGQLDTDINFRVILKNNGIKDVVWGLRTQSDRINLLICADIAELMVDKYEKVYPNDNRIRNHIANKRLFAEGKISAEEYNVSCTSASGAAASASGAAAYAAAYAASAYAASAYAADAATWQKIEQTLLPYINEED